VARFDVYRFANKAAPFVVDVQADLLSDLASRVVVPLAPVACFAKEELPRLKPRITIDGNEYILMTTDIGVLAKAQLGLPVTNIETSHRDDITAALDFLLQGF